jgi:NitT/TauT family transport system substrate-binding protein
MLKQLVEGWMIGSAEINNSDVNKKKAAKILAVGLNQPEDFCYSAINNVRLATIGDNRNFFNTNGNFQGVKAEDLYSDMSIEYAKLGIAPAKVPLWAIGVAIAIASPQ